MKKGFLYIFLMLAYFGFSQESGTYVFESVKTDIINVGDSNNIFFDYDLDGDLDLIISGYNQGISDVTSTHTVLYTNDGKGNFTRDERSVFMGVEYGKIDVGDIDNDKDLDVIITGQELKKDREDGAVIYKNDNGVFKKVKKFQGKGYCTYAGFININNDNYADVLVERDNVYEYNINDKKGDFILKGQLEGIDQAFEYGVVPFDIDADGYDDVIIQGRTPYSIEPKTVFFKNNAGEFKSMPHNFKNTNQGIVTLVDIDNDTHTDIFMTNLGTASENLEHSLFYMNQDGTFQEKMSNVLVYNLGQSCFVDLDNDGDKDLIISGGRNPSLDTYIEVVDIYLNTNGKLKLFKENAFPYLGQGSINAADIDGDGDQDILITGYDNDIPKTFLYKNTIKN